MTEDAYTRIALRLRDVSTADREWLLSQLDADDCRRVSASLQQHRARNAAGTAPGARGRREISTPPGGGAEEPAARLAAAGMSEIRELLAGQPDWAIALLLSAGPWPWTQELLVELIPERIRALRSLAAELAARVKPKFRDAVVRAMALKLKSADTPTPLTQAFDVALERAVNEMSAGGIWKMDPR